MRVTVAQMVHGKFVGEVKMNESGHVLKLDQEHLETVLPNFGGEVGWQGRGRGL